MVDTTKSSLTDDKIDLLSPVKAVRKSAIVAERIKTLILDNRYNIGDRLPSENELAKILLVSRASVREAFRVLEFMGLIEVKSGLGTYVKNKNFFDISKFSNSGLALRLESEAFTMLEVLDARRIFEINIAKMAAENTTPEDLNRVEEILSEWEKSLSDEEGFKNADLKFHRELARITKNRVIEVLADSIYQILNETFPKTYPVICKNPRLSKRTVTLHRRIFEALRAQDPKKAKVYMARHFKMAYQISRGYIEQAMQSEGMLAK